MYTGYLRDITDRRRAEHELRASRARIVEAADAARQRLERDLHDGAQQHLVGVALNLRLARGRLQEGDPAARLVDEAIAELAVAADKLRELARGIHPAVLVEGGLEPALHALLDRCPVPATLRADLPTQRLDPTVEATAYFVVAEALTNVARYARATRVDVIARRHDGVLEVEVSDDGSGGADPSRGTGLRGLGDRLAALDGTLRIRSNAGIGTTLHAEIPCGL
jgi:signal transduction histidine kinase